MKIKKHIKGHSVLAFLLLFSLVFQTNNLAYANNFTLPAPTITPPEADGMQKVTLDWDAPAGVVDPTYYVMRQDSSGSWIPISAHQNPTDDPVEVLMVYPHDKSRDLFKQWMDATNLTNGDAPDINVTRVHNRFRQPGDIVVPGVPNVVFDSNAQAILSDGNGGWNYDVVVLGFWDNFKGHDLSTTSLPVVKDFIQSSQGVLFSHDVFYDYKGKLNTLAPYAGLTLTNKTSKNNNIQSTMVEVSKKGPITTYPFDLTGAAFPIDITNTGGQKPNNQDNVWVKFKEDSGTPSSPTFNTTGGFSPTDVNGFNSFLYSQDNTALIQTGCWSDDSTAGLATITPSEQEKQLIANTIYSLAQTTKNTTLTDKAEDYQSPDQPQQATYDENTRVLELSADENGEEYSYRVVAQPKSTDRPSYGVLQSDLSSNDTSGDSLISTTQDVSVESGMKGFYYSITSDQNYIPTSTDTFIPYNNATLSGSITLPMTGIANNFLVVSAVDKNGNISAPQVFDMDDYPVIMSTVYFEHYDYNGNLITDPATTINRGSMGTDVDHDGVITSEKPVSTTVNLAYSTVTGYVPIDKSPKPILPAPDTMAVVSDNGLPPAENTVKFKYAKMMSIAMKEVTHSNEDLDNDGINDTTTVNANPSSFNIQEHNDYTYTPSPPGPNRTITGYSTNINPTIQAIPTAPINLDADSGINTIYIHYANKPATLTEHYIDANGNDLIPPQQVTIDAGSTSYYSLSTGEMDSVVASPNGDCYTFDHAYKYDGSIYTQIDNDGLITGVANDTSTLYENDVFYKFNPNVVDVIYIGYDFDTPVPPNSTPGALAVVLHHDPQTFDGTTNPKPYIAPATAFGWTLMTTPATHNIDFSAEKSISFNYKKGTPTGQYTANVNYKDESNNDIGSSSSGHIGPTNFSVTKNVGMDSFNIPTIEITDGGTVYEFDHAEFVFNGATNTFPINSFTGITAPLNGIYDITVYYKAKSTINYTFEIYDQDNIIQRTLTSSVIKPMNVPYNLPNFNALPPNTYIYSITKDGNVTLSPTITDFVFTPTNKTHNIEYKIKTKTYKLDVSSYVNGTNAPLTYDNEYTTSVDIDTVLEPDVINGYVFEKFEGVNGSEAYFSYIDPTDPAAGIIFNTDTPGNYGVKAVYKQKSTLTVNYMGQNGEVIASPITIDCFVGDEIQIPHPTQADILTGMQIADYKPFVVYVENNNGGYTDITSGLVHDNIGFNFTPANNNQTIYVGYQMKTYEVNLRVMDVATQQEIIPPVTSNPLPVTAPTHVNVPNVNQYGYEYVSLDYDDNLLTLDGQHSTVKPDDGGFASPYDVTVYVQKTVPEIVPVTEPEPTTNPSVGNHNDGSSPSDEDDSTIYVPNPTMEPKPEPTTAPVVEGLRPPLMLGDPDGNFRPKSNLTRAEVAQVIYNTMYEGEKLPEFPFNDVSEEMWYADAIKFAYSEGYMVGYPDGSFEPEEPVTRAEVMVILQNTLGTTTYDGADIFNDISGHWANNQINNVASSLELEGFEDGSFRPNENIIRGDFAIMIAKATNRVEYTDKVSFNDVNSDDYYYEYINAITNYCE